jgi:hypothetical protein
LQQFVDDLESALSAASVPASGWEEWEELCAAVACYQRERRAHPDAVDDPSARLAEALVLTAACRYVQTMAVPHAPPEDP